MEAAGGPRVGLDGGLPPTSPEARKGVLREQAGDLTWKPAELGHEPFPSQKTWLNDVLKPTPTHMIMALRKSDERRKVEKYRKRQKDHIQRNSVTNHAVRGLFVGWFVFKQRVIFPWAGCGKGLI